MDVHAAGSGNRQGPPPRIRPKGPRRRGPPPRRRAALGPTRLAKTEACSRQAEIPGGNLHGRRIPGTLGHDQRNFKAWIGRQRLQGRHRRTPGNRSRRSAIGATLAGRLLWPACLESRHAARESSLSSYRAPGLSLFTLIIIFLASLALRLYAINWDQGSDLHPDELFIAKIVLIDRIHLDLPEDLGQLLDPATSGLNPRSADPATGKISRVRLRGIAALDNRPLRLAAFAADRGQLERQ